MLTKGLLAQPGTQDHSLVHLVQNEKSNAGEGTPRHISPKVRMPGLTSY
jgi:hypothetical protein